MSRTKTTIRDVAARAGVSSTSVSRVLSGRDKTQMRPETREKILRAIAELSFTPERAAQRLRAKASHVVAVILPDIANPFFSLLARGVESLAVERGYCTLICDSENSCGKELQNLNLLSTEGLDGAVLVPVSSPDCARLERLTQEGLQIVIADRRVQGYPEIGAANAEGSYELTSYLLMLGYRRVGYLAGPAGVSTAEDRLAGFEESMAVHGVTPVAIARGDFTYESGRRLSLKMLREKEPDAIIAANDLMAIGALRAAESRGLLAPGDIGVAGFDHVPWTQLVVPELTSVRIPSFEIGREAMALLAKQLGGASDVAGKVFATELVRGATTRRVRGSKAGRSATRSHRKGAAGRPHA
ncbi:MAG: LacI family DNA-binding transcriptional regulator [Candidatus Bipolaricaulis sp.]|nr:LacI family DNA-binding transcriptional regulator [Candidatus Bipolaricaulis sp.]MDD5646908.1 LacI family DNA-binding transcriptional regulator [Candidatus Bipolaricaulis sp.]